MGNVIAGFFDRVDKRLAPLPPTVGKLVRYTIASFTGTASYLVAIVLINGVIGLADMPSHLISVTLSSIPNYLVNRYWTWKQEGKNRLWGEVVPFWAIAFMGFLLSLVFVDYASDHWGTTLSIAAANMAAFGVLWLGRFVFLDKVMWKVIHQIEPDLDETEFDTPTTAG
jgi:putative flippase GtrA